MVRTSNIGCRSRKHTMMMIIPTELSRRTNIAAQTRIKIVTGIAARVRENSMSALSVTITTNCTVNPRKKKKSNLRSAT
jgi:hypothetical protein